jgi:hypothetical protein
MVSQRCRSSEAGSLPIIDGLDAESVIAPTVTSLLMRKTLAELGKDGKRHYPWRAIDQGGNVLDILVQRRPDNVAANRFFRKFLRGILYVLRVIISEN